MTRFAFAFFASQWRESLIWPFRHCLHSLETRGGEAAQFDKYLVHLEEPTPSLLQFAADHGLTLVHEQRLTWHQELPNKALLCRVPQHEVVCMADLDLIFLGDPTPAFEQAAHEDKILARLDLLRPLRTVRSVLQPLFRLLLPLLEYIWLAQYPRFSRAGRPASLVPHPDGRLSPPYFNAGVVFSPGKYLRDLGDACWHICSTLLHDFTQRRKLYTLAFAPYFFEQMSFALGLHRQGYPWGVLPSEYNYIPVPFVPDSDRRIPSSQIRVVHLVNPVRHWLAANPGQEAVNQVDPRRIHIYREVRAIVEEVATRQKDNLAYQGKLS